MCTKGLPQQNQAAKADSSLDRSDKSPRMAISFLLVHEYFPSSHYWTDKRLRVRQATAPLRIQGAATDGVYMVLLAQRTHRLSQQPRPFVIALVLASVALPDSCLHPFGLALPCAGGEAGLCCFTQLARSTSLTVQHEHTRRTS